MNDDNDSKRFLVANFAEDKRFIFVRFPKDPLSVEIELLDVCTRVGASWFNSITDEMIIEYRFDSFEESTRNDISDRFAQAKMRLTESGWLEFNHKNDALSVIFWSGFEKQ